MEQGAERPAGAIACAVMADFPTSCIICEVRAVTSDIGLCAVGASYPVLVKTFTEGPLLQTEPAPSDRQPQRCECQDG